MLNWKTSVQIQLGLTVRKNTEKPGGVGEEKRTSGFGDDVLFATSGFRADVPFATSHRLGISCRLLVLMSLL